MGSIQRITAKLALASQLALKAHRYQFSSYMFVSAGLTCLLFRIHEAFLGADTSLWIFAIGVFFVWIGWWCNKVSDVYLQDLGKIRK